MHYPTSLTAFASRLAIGALCLSSFAVSSHAAALFWDTDGDAAIGYGGDGTWDTTASNWNTSSAGAGVLQTWNNAASPFDSAIFTGGGSGTVTVSGTVIAAGMTFGSSPNTNTTYTLSGGVVDLRTASFSNAVNNRGTNTLESDLYLFGAMTSNTTNRQRLVNTSGTLNLANIRDTSGFAGTHELSLENYSSTINITGDITKNGSTGVTLFVGGTSTSNGANYTLGGNNTGLGGVVTVYRGKLNLNNSNALGGASSVTVANASAAPGGVAGTADTASVLIGTGGVSINKNITFSSSSDTGDTRTIGSSNTTGTATYSGTITLGAFAASGNGSTLRVTAEAGGTTVFTGLINDGANTTSITKTGSGIVKFTRAAGVTYDGITTVSTGSLIVNNTSGSGTGTGAVSVSNGATFGGTGSSAGAITLDAGARMSPGDMDESGVSSTGNFTGGSLTWNSDSAVGMSFNLGADQGSSDQLTLSGAFTKGTGSTFVFDFTGSTLNSSIVYTLVTFGSTDFVVGDFSAINGGDGVFALNGTTLTFGAIPEPSTYAALAGTLVLAGAVWRRRAGIRSR